MQYTLRRLFVVMTLIAAICAIFHKHLGNLFSFQWLHPPEVLAPIQIPLCWIMAWPIPEPEFKSFGSFMLGFFISMAIHMAIVIAFCTLVVMAWKWSAVPKEK